VARSSWTGRAGNRDVIRAYQWFSLALEQLARGKNMVKKTMNPAELAEAERRVRERLTKSQQRLEGPLSSHTSSAYPRGFVA
jgi:hypothetical protein